MNLILNKCSTSAYHEHTLNFSWNYRNLTQCLSFSNIIGQGIKPEEFQTIVHAVSVIYVKP